jgi:hypothetical protein
MDYSKKDGGTRVHDPLKARTLATGIGQTETSARIHGSHRLERVVAGMKPGQHCSDPALCEVRDRHDREREMMASAHMDSPHGEPDPTARIEQAFPLKSTAFQSHQQAGTIAPPATSKNDQGEQSRRPATGRAAHPGMQISPTVK